MVRSTCAIVGAEGEDTLVETLKELPQRQTVLDLESRNTKLKEEMKKLKEELEDERKANSIGAAKLGKSMELIRKMEGMVQQSVDILNKAKLFKASLTKNQVTAAKVIPVLVDFNQKMDEILMDMQALFEGLEVSGLVPLDQVPNISINTEELPTLQGWNARSHAQTPTPSKPATTPKPTSRKEQQEAGPSKGPEPKPVPTNTIFVKMRVFHRNESPKTHTFYEHSKFYSLCKVQNNAKKPKVHTEVQVPSQNN